MADLADAFKHKHQVNTTPQVFKEGERIGGYEALRGYFGLVVPGEGEVSYKPIVAIFSVAFLMAFSYWPAR